MFFGNDIATKLNTEITLQLFVDVKKQLTGQTRLLLVKIELANGVMYFSILVCLKLDLVILCFFDGIFSRLLGTRWIICSVEPILIKTHMF